MSEGALAQLVEHLLCKQRVIGSNPIGSTRTYTISTSKNELPRHCRRQVFDIVNGGLTRPELRLHSTPLAGWKLDTYNSLRVGFE